MSPTPSSFISLQTFLCPPYFQSQRKQSFEQNEQVYTPRIFALAQLQIDQLSMYDTKLVCMMRDRAKILTGIPFSARLFSYKVLLDICSFSIK
eukprot:UN24876